MRTLKYYIPCFFAVCLCITGYTQNDFSVISSRIREQVCKETSDQVLLKNVVSFLPALKQEGYWPDIDYSNKDITKWKPGNHLDRIKIFAQAFVKEKGGYYNNTDVLNAIINALRYWYTQNPKSNNWWHNEIATPQSIGEILILLQQSTLPFPAGLEDSLVKRMKQGDVFNKTGANKLDIALHMIYRACIVKDKALMDTAIQQAFQPIEFTSEEGIQYDYSYLQHGPQLQISSYGLVFLTGEYKVASWVRGTPYALSGRQLKMLNHYLLNTFLPAIRGRYIDFNTEGRGISRKDILDKRGLAVNEKNSSLLEWAKMVSPENTTVINAASERIAQQQSPGYSIIPAHHFFWKADYTQHLRQAYTFNVRMVSNRTKRTETGNKENLTGKYLPDGSTNIQRSGKEYFNIMPVWEWDKIPGITARDFSSDRQTVVQWGENGSTSFVGGVSDSLYGVSCYDMNYDSVQAKKAWFFFDKEVICLGAGISSNASEEIATTINQCWLEGKVKIFSDGKETTVKKSYAANNVNWIWHDSIGYFFYNPANVSVTAQKQKGSWSSINASQPKEEVEGDVFKLWLNHNSRPVDSSYAYSVVPGVAVTDLEHYQFEETIVLSNTKAFQAICSKKLDIIECVFYNGGTVLMDDLTIAVNKPCVLLIKNVSGTNPVIHIADPSQQEKYILLSIKSKALSVQRSINVEMPKGQMAGSSFTLKL